MNPSSTLTTLKSSPASCGRDVLNNADWKSRLLAGDPEAKKQLLAWGTIAVTAEPFERDRSALEDGAI
jgi:hypothetical protein